MITLTPDAQNELENIIDSAGAASNVRVSVVRGPHGCVHGWSLGLENDADRRDVVLSFGELQLLIEPGLADALEGARIDYREDATRIGFIIDAPNSQALATAGGGCGSH